MNFFWKRTSSHHSLGKQPLGPNSSGAAQLFAAGPSSTRGLPSVGVVARCLSFAGEMVTWTRTWMAPQELPKTSEVSKAQKKSTAVKHG